MRVVVLTPIPTPYRDPFWARMAVESGIDLQVFYLAAGKPDRPWKAEWIQPPQSIVLSGRNLARRPSTGASLYWNPGAWTAIRAIHPDAVLLGGYNHLTLLHVLRQCRRVGTPYFLMCESHGLKVRSAWRRTLKRPLLRWIIRGAAGAFPTGRLAEAYLASYGAGAGHMSRLPNVPDVDRLRSTIGVLRAERAALRASRGLPTDLPIILFVGRLIANKRAADAVTALARLSGEPAAHLVIVGDGPERAALEILARRAGVTDRVHFAGFAAPADLVSWYALADLFVLPSSETWGVAAIEALACGLPVVLSDHVGCHPDVLANAITGETFAHGSIPALTEALERRLRTPIRSHDVDAAWQGVRDALRYDTIARETRDFMEQRLAARTEPDA